MKGSTLCCVLLGLMTACFAAGCASAGVSGPVGEKGVVILGDFEDGSTNDWAAGGDTTLSVSLDHPTRGNKALKAEFGTTGYPGIGLTLKDADWSKYAALRLSVFNPSTTHQKLAVRIDDLASTDYGTRYNLDSGLPLRPGLNELEVTVASLKIGTLLSRGLDVRRIRQVRFFMSGLKKPVTLYFDNIRLVPARADGPARLVLSDFDGTVNAKRTTAEGTRDEIANRPDGAGGKALRLTLTPAGSYPGISFYQMPQDWLDYDLLAIDLYCPQDKPTPRSISLKLVGADGTRQTLATGLTKGLNRIRLPLVFAGFTSLGRITNLQVFIGKPREDQVIYIDDVALLRVNGVEAGATHTEAPADARLKLDFEPMKPVGRNTCFGAIVWVPMKDGVRIYHANAPGRGPLSYGFGADALRDADPSQPVQAWGLFLDHGVWHWTRKEAKLEGDKPVVITFDDPKAFAR